MSDRETEMTELTGELRRLKDREHEIRDRLLLLAETAPGLVTPAVGSMVYVTDEGCARYGQLGRVEHVDVNLMLAVKVKFVDGCTVGFRSWELRRA